VKRILIFVGAVVVALAGAVLIVPSFVDWTEYRDTFEQRLEAATGRDVEIDGAVAMSVLPRPALALEGVRVGSIPGATNADFLAADSISVNLAVAPLLGGRVQFSSIELARPVIFAEVLADGRATWEFALGEDGQESSDTNADAESDLGIDSLLITDGTIRYSDASSGNVYDIEGISAEISAPALSGPFDVSATAGVNGTVWDVIATHGAIRSGRASTFVLELAALDTALTGRFAGATDFTGNSDLVSGRVEFRAEQLGAALGAAGFSEIEAAPSSLLNDSASLSGEISVASSGLEAEELEIALGETSATGTGSFEWGAEPRFALDLQLGRTSLDGWIDGRADATTRHALMTLPSVFRSAHAQDQASASFALPSNLSGTLDVTASLMEWRGQLLRNGRLAAILADGEVTITELGVDLPGNSSVAANGFLSVEEGAPLIDLDARFTSRNFRSFLAWWDAEPSADIFPPGRLNALSIESRISVSPAQVELSNVAVTLDSTQATGSGRYELGQTSNLYLDLSIGSFDLDSYLPALLSRDNSIAEPAGETQATNGESVLFPELGVSSTIRVKTLTAGGYIIDDFELDATVSGADIEVARLAGADLAGLSFQAAGRVKNALSAPQLSAFQIQANTSDTERVARAFAIDLPRLPLISAGMTVDARLTGDRNAADVEGSFSLGGLNSEFNGTASLAMSSFDGDVALTHPDYATLLRALGLMYPEAVASPGSVAATASLKTEPGSVQVRTVEARAGENALAGTITTSTTDSGVNVTGQIAIENADFDVLFPSDPAEALRQSSRSRRVQSDAQVSERWSTEQFPQAMFDGVTASLDLTAGVLKGRGLYLEQVRAPIVITENTMSVSGWTAYVFGGAGTGDLRLASGADLGIAALIDVKEADLAKSALATSAGSVASGKLSLQAAVSGRGTSLSSLVSTLEGRGIFVGQEIDAGDSGATGIAGALIAPVRALSQLGGLLSGGVTKGLANMRASFAGAQGMFALSDATVQSNVYSGDFEGFIDVARWWVDVEGRVRLEANLITQLLGNRIQMPSLIPVTVTGPLESPNVRTLATPTQAQPQQQVSPTAPPAGQQQQSAEPNPVDLFRGISNELANPN